MTGLVSLSVDDRVAIVRLERPEKLNAFTYAMIAELRETIDRAIADERVFGVVITGAGRAFSAGLDLGDLARTARTAGASGASASSTSAPSAPAAPEPGPNVGPDVDADADAEELPALFAYLLRSPKPIIGAINGVAAGGGFVLAMMCDLRIAAHGSSFTTAFSKRGLVAEHGTSWVLPRLVGTNRALDLLWSARRIDAAEAHRMGFVDRLVDDGTEVDAACEYVRDLAANVSPRSVALMKEQVLRGWSQPLPVALRQVDREVREALDHPDATEGVASFVERRPPRFAPPPNAPLSPGGPT